jgi:SAM-dependent methyltransferase
MRIKANPEHDWHRLAELDPYYGVLSNNKFKHENLTEATKEDFFCTGVKHMQTCLDTAKTLFSHHSGGRALDFGCGVGRLTCAMAPHFSEVVGLDISPAMLTEARKETTKRAFNNVVYDLSTEESRFAPDTYDFIHSYIVFQHIPVSAGEYILKRMLGSLKIHGVGAIHLTYGNSQGAIFARLRAVIKNYLPLRAIGNLAIGRKWDYPAMQMNNYNIPRVLKVFSEHNINKLVVYNVDDFGNTGLYLFFQKPDWSSRKLKPLPPDPFRHQDSVIAQIAALEDCLRNHDDQPDIPETVATRERKDQRNH